MKKQQHLFLAAFAIAAMAGICSCNNDDELAAGQSKSIHVFTATMEGNPATRATFNSENKCASWEKGDEVNINGKIYKANNNGVFTTLTPAIKGGEAEGETYTAYFPASLYSEDEEGNVVLTLPSEINETYVEGKFNMPMYATSNDDVLDFKNLCAVLRITVSSEKLTAVKKIRISSSKSLSGVFTVKDHGATLKTTNLSDRTITVNYTQPVATTKEGTVFYVAIPVSASKCYHLTVELSSDGEDFDLTKVINENQVTVARSTIYPVNFTSSGASTGTAKAIINEEETDVDWVQLWKGGPKFSTVNLMDGFTFPMETNYHYYSWGSSIDSDPNGEYKIGTGSLTGTDDTATKLWGSNWRMPTKAEFEDLLKNCNCVWTTFEDETYTYPYTGSWGALFTPKDDDSGICLFLPAANAYVYGTLEGTPHSDCCYWSSTAGDYNPGGGEDGADIAEAYYLYVVGSYTPTVEKFYPRYYSFPIRPVLVE